MRRLFVVLALLGLSACASISEGVLKAGTSGDVRFDPDDVDAAIAIAQDAKDKVAEACFRAIRAHTGAPVTRVTKGVVSTYAAARVRVREARAQLAEDVHTACAPLVIDAGTFIDQLPATFMGLR